MHKLSYAPPEPKKRLISTRALVLLACGIFLAGFLAGAKPMVCVFAPARAVADATGELFGPNPRPAFVALRVPQVAFSLGLLLTAWGLVRRHSVDRDPSRHVLVSVLAVGIVAFGIHAWGFRVAVQRYGTFWAGGGTRMCISNLIHLHLALLIYAHEHAGALPASLAQLVEGPDAALRPEGLVCPWDESGGSYAQGPYRSSFVYLGAGKREPLPADLILAYEDPKVHGSGHTFVLYGDGRVNYVESPGPLLAKLAAGYNPPTTAPVATRPQGGGTK